FVYPDFTQKSLALAGNRDGTHIWIITEADRSGPARPGCSAPATRSAMMREGEPRALGTVVDRQTKMDSDLPHVG
ncbi:MAG TPA: hypothetical protein VG370_27005, partial [Chloroflexota bacterium]|nr:hypothetical protein [Chloroflexota bacterium]